MIVTPYEAIAQDFVNSYGECCWAILSFEVDEWDLDSIERNMRSGMPEFTNKEEDILYVLAFGKNPPRPAKRCYRCNGTGYEPGNFEKLCTACCGTGRRNRVPLE